MIFDNELEPKEKYRGCDICRKLLQNIKYFNQIQCPNARDETEDTLANHLIRFHGFVI